MTNAIKELKTRAEILHKQIQAGNLSAVNRLPALPRLRRFRAEQLLEGNLQTRRLDCLNVIAIELGFASWLQVKMALAGEGEATNYGTLLYRDGGHINRWYADYNQALRDLEANSGFLLAYKRQYLVVDRYFIESLQLDPDDEDWAAIEFNWVRPKSLPARTRLYDKLVASLPREAGRGGRRL